MSIENVFLNQINQLEGKGKSDILLACLDVVEEHDLVMSTAASTAQTLLSFREEDGEKLSPEYKSGYREGFIAKLEGKSMMDTFYSGADGDVFWGWTDGWIDGY